MAKKQKDPNPETVIVIGPMTFKMTSIASFLKGPNARLVFVDGGLSHRNKLLKKAPALVKSAISIGDGDSSKKKMTIKKTNQNLSDLSFFLKTFSKENNIGRFVFAGFLGGRFDHHLINFGEITLFLKHFDKKSKIPRLLFEDQVEFFPKGAHKLTINGHFSVASLEENSIKIKGECDYPTKKWVKLLPLSSLGLSNIGHGEVFIETKKPLMVFFPKL